MAQAAVQAEADPVVSVRQVDFAYNGHEVLHRCSLQVQAGDMLGIIGPNGGGKTTLLRLILGELRPQAGEVLVFGRPAHSLGRLRRLIGYVPQRETVEWDFPATAADVVIMGAFSAVGPGRPVGRAAREQALRLMQIMGMEGLENRPFGKLSGGQQQRVFVARALMGSPRLLLLDEPTSGIDIGGIEAFFGQLRELQQRFELTVVMVSHDLEHLRHVADRLACVFRSIHWHGRAEAVTEEVIRRSGQFCELDAYLAHADTHHRGQCGEDEPCEL